MDTARAARAHILCTSIALLLILIVSCLTYIFLPKVPDCKKASALPLNVSEVSSILRGSSREHWLLKAYNHKKSCLMWENEWGTDGEIILDHNDTLINIQEKGVYLIYIQVNFQLNQQKDPAVDLSFQVHFNMNESKEIFSAAHDTPVVNENSHAMLNTFLLMNLEPANQLSVKAYPSNLVMFSPRPFSTYITIIKWAD